MEQTATIQILKALLNGEHLSGLDILYKYETYRASAVIHRLRSAGWPIKTTMRTTFKGKRHAIYHMDFVAIPKHLR